MQKITPFLWFDKNAEEAVNFYVSVFAGSPKARAEESRIVSLNRYPDGPLEGPMKGMEGRVLTAVFELAGLRFMALDGGPYYVPSGAVSMYVECADQAEVDYFWSRLTEGGDPEAQQCGWLKDKFGFTWQIIPAEMGALVSDPDPVKSGRAMQAMFPMKKIDLAVLKAAHDGTV